jgi:hypothetical protein
MEKGKAFLHIRRQSRKEKDTPAVSALAALHTLRDSDGELNSLTRTKFLAKLKKSL